MKDISSYLEKFKKFKNPKDDKETIVRVVKEVTGFEVRVEEINFQKGVVMFKINPYLRTAINNKKGFILDELKKAGLAVTTIA